MWLWLYIAVFLITLLLLWSGDFRRIVEKKKPLFGVSISLAVAWPVFWFMKLALFLSGQRKAFAERMKEMEKEDHV